jgi:chaperonin cofactor prefoldin
LGLANFDPDKPIADRQDAIGRLRNKYILYQPQLLALLEGFEDMAKAWRVWERNHVALRELIKISEPAITLKTTLEALSHNLREVEAKLRRKEERVELREEKLQLREEKIEKRNLELDEEMATP